MNEVNRLVTTATIKQSLCDRREAIRQQSWTQNLGRWSKLESVPPVFRSPAARADAGAQPEATQRSATQRESENDV